MDRHILKYILLTLVFASSVFSQQNIRVPMLKVDSIYAKTSNAPIFLRDSVKINSFLYMKHLSYTPTKIPSYTNLWGRSDSALMWGTTRVDSARPSPLAMVRGLSTPTIPALDTLVIDSTNGLRLTKSGTKGTIDLPTSANVTLNDLSIQTLTLSGVGSNVDGDVNLNDSIYLNVVNTNSLLYIGNASKSILGLPHSVTKKIFVPQGTTTAPKYGTLKPLYGIDTLWTGTDDTLSLRIDTSEVATPYGLTLKADKATTITIAGTTNQITSSAGAQDLSANRTWTLSVPSTFRIGTSAFGNMGMLESASGYGWRWTLNNDQKARWQFTNNGFSSATTVLTVDTNKIVTFARRADTDTISPLTPTGTLIIKGGDGRVTQSDDSSGVILKFVTNIGTPIMRVISDSARVGLKGGDDKVATSGQSTGHVNILDPLWVEEDLWVDESAMFTGGTHPLSMINTTSVDTAYNGLKWIRVASTSNFALGRSFEVGLRAADNYEVHRVAAMSGDTIFTTDKFSYKHNPSERAATYSYKASIFPIHWNMWQPGGYFRIGAKVTRAEVDSFTAQTIEHGAHAMYANHTGKLLANMVIDGGRVDTTSPASMGVDVDSGIGLINRASIDGIDKSYTFEALTQDAVTISAADNDSNRTDLVYWDSSGVVRVSTGALSAGAGTVPTLPSKALALAQVAVTAGATTITSANITDVRNQSEVHASSGSNANISSRSFVWTNTSVNTDVSTFAQAIDTSAFSISSSAGGRMTLRMNSQAGANRFLVDTNSVAHVAGGYSVVGTFGWSRLLESSTGYGWRKSLNNNSTILTQFTNNGGSSFTTAMIQDTNLNIRQGNVAPGTSAVRNFVQASGTAPASSPADASADWTADINAVAGNAGKHFRNEMNTASLIMPGVRYKTDTGDPSDPFEGMMVINTFDNTFKVYAEGAWRSITTW